MMPWWHARPVRPTLELHITQLPGIERRCVVDKFPVLIGRSPDADLHVADAWASRVHCGLDFVEGCFVLRDLESHNGTWVNREKISEKVLEVGDAIDVGTTRIVVVEMDGD
jgi:pSer/pThr/pTyr-binding forkhead associated (FHA) protein